MPTHAPALADRDALFEAVCNADLLTPAQLRRAAEAVTGSGVADAPAAAAALVAAGLLTRFQADQLLAGRGAGLRLGPYAVLDPLGRGPRGRVYKARHRSMNRLVAVKVLAAELTRTADARQRVRDGVRAAGKLSHPNVVTAYDANELNGWFYLVLEFVDGSPLADLVRARGPLPVAEACEYVRRAAHGLAHAHAHGVAHGTLHPRNVLVGPPTPSAPAAVKVSDFGLPPVAGDAPFRAPELAAPGRPADARADLYSLGAVFHFLLTGRPHPGPVRLEVSRPAVPPPVAAVVHRLLAPDPGARFASATELLAVLEPALGPAVPAEWVSFDLPARAYQPDSGGYLPVGYSTHGSGVVAVPVSRELPAPEPCPWEQITSATAADPAPTAIDDRTPAPPRALRAAPRTRGGESVPLWMTALLLVCVVLLSLLGIGAVVRALGK